MRDIILSTIKATEPIITAGRRRVINGTMSYRETGIAIVIDAPIVIVAAIVIQPHTTLVKKTHLSAVVVDKALGFTSLNVLKDGCFFFEEINNNIFLN